MGRFFDMLVVHCIGAGGGYLAIGDGLEKCRRGYFEVIHKDFDATWTHLSWRSAHDGHGRHSTYEPER
jgi:hypothetical protein